MWSTNSYGNHISRERVKGFDGHVIEMVSKDARNMLDV
jgi:hypothetical protein